MAANKWALLVGIDRYRHAPLPGFTQLEGCRNDVADMRALLTRKFAFPESHVVTIEDSHATRANILDCIRETLVAKAEPGDIVVFYYSGHGSEAISPGRINDRDQTIVPHDGRDPKGEVDDITGAHLNANLAGLRSSNATFIFDSCHSGTMRSRACHRPRVAVPASPLAESPSGAARAVRPLVLSSAGYALLAASAPNELSFETVIDGKVRGLLTYYLCRELRASSRPLTYRDLLDSLKGMIARWEPDQHPQLEGAAADSVVFGDTVILAQPYILVSPESDGAVLDAGRELGMTVGSVFDVFAPGAKQFNGIEPPVARIQLAEVADFRSSAKVLSGGPIAINCRAVEIQHTYEPSSLRVHVAGGQRLGAIRSELATLPFVEITSDGGGEIQFWEDQDEIWMEQPGGIRSVLPSSTQKLGEEVRIRVSNWARWLQLLRVGNPSSKLDVTFNLAAIPDGAYSPGGHIQCRIANNSDRDLYLTLLEFSDDGGIRMLMPAAGIVQVLYAGRILVRQFEIEKLPSGLKMSHSVLKLIASTAQKDFSGIEMSPLTPPVDNRALIPLLFDGSGHRSGETASLDWIAIERGFAVSSVSSSIAGTESSGKVAP